MTSPSGSLDGQVLTPVSMTGATTVTVDVDLIAWKDPTTSNTLRVEVRLQQGSDGANWFPVTPPAGNALDQALAINTVAPVFTNVGMASARVVLMIDNTTGLNPGDGAIVKVVITTS